MRNFPTAVLLLCMLMPAVSHGRQPDATDYEREFHSAVPLGAERIDLSSGKTMYVLATAESPMFEGLRARDSGTSKMLLLADGSPARFFPQHLEFRVTATAMRPALLTIDSYGRLNLSDSEINDYLLQLGFSVLIFHGLEVTRVEPGALRLIGMPADVDYEERVYQVSFDLPHTVSTDDRIVFEVRSPGGSRLCKFHLDFF